MTNWYSTSIKADLADLLRTNPHPVDILNFVLQHGDMEEIIDSMSTDGMESVVEKWMDSRFNSGAELHKIKDVIRDYCTPDEVFSKIDLEKWANDEEWMSPKYKKQVFDAFLSLEGLLSSGMNALEPWQDEINKLSDLMEELED